jgi:hypothetical protein
MRTRFTWVVAVLALVAIGMVMACSTKYSSTSNGLIVVPTENPLTVQTFSLDLSNGSVSQINNVNAPLIPGPPSAVLIDPAGAYVYLATTITCTPTLPPNTSLPGIAQGAIVAYMVASDGKVAQVGNPTYLTGNPTYPSTFPTCGLDDSTNPNPSNPIAAMAMDSAGKYLFVATAPTGATYTTNTNSSTPIVTNITLNSVGIAVYAIGAGASLTQVPGSPFALPVQSVQPPSPSALAVTRTAYPINYAACSGGTAPTTENLYVTDAVNYVVLNYSVNTSTGLLTLVPATPGGTGVPTGAVPMGVAVDPCNRFVYVANNQSNNVNAYTICSSISVTPNCQQVDYSLLPVAGSPYNVGDSPGPLAVDAYGTFLYVVDMGSNQISAFRIGSATGGLTALTPATIATGQGGANSIAIRSDDSFLFVANNTSESVSQYGIVPATGALSPDPVITTFNLPSGVAVH